MYLLIIFAIAIVVCLGVGCMCLWSIHPKYLDKLGLIALWREGLLAQKALSVPSTQYIRHSELERFKNNENPLKAIGSYLCYVAAEGAKRGYNFTHERIVYPNFDDYLIIINDDTLNLEVKNLKNKLKLRDKTKFKELTEMSKIESNPAFYLK